jgi:hypothetical protein
VSCIGCGPASAIESAPPTDAIPGKIAPGPDAPKTDLSKQNGELSDKLNKSNGVIRPEDGIDPKMQKPTPATGAMPVIPPPDAPGAQPK